MYLENVRQFWSITINHMWFLKNWTMLYFFINHMLFFFSNIIEQVFFTNQKLEMNNLQIFKTKCMVNFKKYGSKKKVSICCGKNGITQKLRMVSMGIFALKPRFNPFLYVSPFFTFTFFCESSKSSMMPTGANSLSGPIYSVKNILTCLLNV